MSRAPRRAVGILIGLAVLSSGCLYQGVNRVAFVYPSRSEAEVSQDQLTHTYLAGAVDVSETCSAGFAEIALYQTGPQASLIPIVPLLMAPLLVSESTIDFLCLEE